MEELFTGESKNIEYKREIPRNSAKYMKTIVAFANGKGGKIVFGIEDQTGEIIGIDRDVVFQQMDAITNAISDSCQPTIIPDVTLRTIEDKTMIVVEITAGRQQPYFIKALGLQAGTYIRVAGTARPVEDYMLKELILLGQNRHYDQEPCENISVTNVEIDQLCENLKHVAIKNTRSDEDISQVRDISKNTLLTWGLLTEINGKLIPTKAFTLLSEQFTTSPLIQCAIFKGRDRSVFVDRREISGPIQDQVEGAFQYILEKINLGAQIKGLYRHDIYELPIGSIRELIANAVAHRSYLEPGNIQVSLYDDRLEITSPGMLLNGVSIEKMKQGYSKIRNRAICNAFSYMKIIEQWGSGIPRIINECSEYSLKEPELIDLDGDFRVNLYRLSLSTSVQTTQTNQTNQTHQTLLSEPETALLKLIEGHPKMTNAEMAQELQWNISRVKYYLQKMKKDGLIQRFGTVHNGYWKVYSPLT